MRSVQNEVEAAIGRGAAWLIAAQAGDGSWDGGNRYLTTLCALALYDKASLTPTQQAASLNKAMTWLAQQPAAPATNETDIAAAAWSQLLFQTVRPDAPQPGAKHLKLPETATAGYSLLTCLITHEVALMRNRQPATTETHPMLRLLTNATTRLIVATQSGIAPAQLQRWADDLGAAWMSPAEVAWRTHSAQHAWWLVRALNRGARGVLYLQPDLPIDWRREMAESWVNTQRIAPQGGGYWLGADKQTPSLAESAFAVMLLREL